MKQISLFLLALLSVISLPASPLTKDEGQENDHIFWESEKQASFPGGNSAFMQWLADNLQYPESALKDRVEGRVIVKFAVEKDGSITDPKIVRGVNKAFDAEALRLVKLMPKWEPGTNFGIPVKSYFIMPVVFRLPKEAIPPEEQE